MTYYLIKTGREFFLNERGNPQKFYTKQKAEIAADSIKQFTSSPEKIEVIKIK